MNANSVSASYQHASTAFATQSALPVEPLPVAAKHDAPEAHEAPVVRSSPRFRRSIELENQPAGDGAHVNGLTLSQRQEWAGNIHNTFCLIRVLKEIREAVAKDSKLDVAGLLETTRFSVHSLSAFGKAYKVAPEEQVSVAWFLKENQLNAPQNIEQLSNLIEVSNEPLLEPVKQGNYWGLLSQPVTLDAAQLSRLRALAADEMAKLSPGKGIFGVFQAQHGASVQGKSAADILEAMLGSPEVQALGQTLKEAFKGTAASLSSSPADLAMAAMVLELDPQAGSKRGWVAGYDLYQASNWGFSPSVVVDRLTQHLVTQGKVNADMAPAAARLLLAGAAPAFIVADMPDNLMLGSAAFARLSTVVEMQEFWVPGVAQHTDFQTFMRLANLGPVSQAEAIVESKAQTHALIEWSIAQGLMPRKADDAYTLEEVSLARASFNTVLTNLKKAQEQLNATLPNRRQMALENLKVAYGSAGPFDVRNISIANIDASESEYHSLLEIYMAGKMDRIPRGERYDFQIGDRFPRVKPLPDVKQAFDTQFNTYFNDLKEGVATTVRSQLSQLPLQDRQAIASGKVEFFSLRKASVAEAEGEESPAQAQAAKARYGVLMRVQSKIDKNGSDQDPKNLRHAYYEIFPLQGIIRRRDDLPRHLPNPPPRVANAQTYATTRAEGVGAWVDYAAYEGNTPPQAETFSGGLLTTQLSSPNLPELKQDPVGAAYFNARLGTIADVVAGHLLHDRDALYAGAKGVTEVEKEEAGIKAGHDFVTGLIPFKNAIENAVKGSTGAAIRDFALDIFGFILPFAKGAGQAGRALGKLSDKVGTRAFKASDIVLRSAASSLNPGDGLGDLVLGLARGGKTMLQKNYRELNELLLKQDFNFGTSGRVSNALADTSGDAGRKLPDFSTHALPDSLLDGHVMRADGTFQIGDQHYVRYTDGTGSSQVFEISRVYKVTGGHVRVIDPVSRKTVAFLEPAGAGQWRLNRMLGGAPPELGQGTSTGMSVIRPQARIRPAAPGSSTSHSASATGQSPVKWPKVPEAFPGEKALMETPVKGVNQFYHYTGKKAHDSIVGDWTFESSVLNPAGKPLPRGKGRHYFTDLAPEDKASAKISETIFGRRKHGNTLDKMTHYYEVNTSGLTMMKTDNPHIFYVDTQFALPLKYRVQGEPVSRIISHGETPYTPVG